MGRFLILVRSDDGAFPAEKVESIMHVLRGIGTDGCQLVFSTPDCTVFGATIKTDKPAAYIRGALTHRLTFQDKGFVLILGLSGDMDGVGNSSGWRHLQH